VYPLPKRRWPGLLAAYLLLIAILAVVAVPLYYYLAPLHKPLVIRVCAGIVLAFTLRQLVRTGREQLARQPVSAFAVAARPRTEAIRLAPQFDTWRDAVTYSLRDRSYFAHILRPRLLALFDRKLRARYGSGVARLMTQPLDGVDPKLLAVLLHGPASQPSPRWGMSLRTLRALVQTLDDLS
jgi:hypothetical protein